MGKKSFNALDKLIERAYEVIGKKLTTKTRKALPAGVFCGPGRSFPVHDCVHVRAAKVYLKRSKFSGATQAKIAACINRKAKALGCPGTIPAKGKGAFELSSKELADLMESKIFESTKKLVEESIKNEGMDLDFAEVAGCDCIEEAQKNNEKKTSKVMCNGFPASTCPEVENSMRKLFKDKNLSNADKKKAMSCLNRQSTKLGCRKE